MAKKRTASRAGSPKGSNSKKKSVKRSVKKPAKAGAPTGVSAGAAYLTKEGGVNLRPLKRAIRETIELLAKSKETPKIAGALESLVAVQQRLTDECTPNMILPNS